MPDVEETLRAVDTALDEEDFERALALAGDALRRFPADPDVRAAYGEALWALDDLRRAREAFREAVRLAPDSPGLWADLARLHFQLADFQVAATAATRSLELEETPEALDLLCRLAERQNDMRGAEKYARRAHRLDAQGFPLPFRVAEGDFREAVQAALEEIPEKFREVLDGDAVILVEPFPALELLRTGEPPLDPELLGLYVGVPLPERDGARAAPGLPDRIYLFQRNLEHVATNKDELIEQIRTTMFHEVGHYFGFSDEELEERDFG